MQLRSTEKKNIKNPISFKFLALFRNMHVMKNNKISRSTYIKKSIWWREVGGALSSIITWLGRIDDTYTFILLLLFFLPFFLLLSFFELTWAGEITKSVKAVNQGLKEAQFLWREVHNSEIQKKNPELKWWNIQKWKNIKIFWKLNPEFSRIKKKLDFMISTQRYK